MTDDWLTPREVARILHVHVNTVKRLCDRGELTFVRVVARGDRRIRREDLDEFLFARRVEGAHYHLHGEVLRSHKEGGVTIIDEMKVDGVSLVRD